MNKQKQIINWTAKKKFQYERDPWILKVSLQLLYFFTMVGLPVKKVYKSIQSVS